MTKLRKVLEGNQKVLEVEAKVDLPEGVLLAVIKDGGVNKAVLATNVITASATPVLLKAVGIADRVSMEKWGTAFEFNKTQQLDAGDFIELRHNAMIENVEEMPADAKLGDKVWLGVDGKLVFTEPTASDATESVDGVLLQEVGVVRNVERQIVEIML